MGAAVVILVVGVMLSVAVVVGAVVGVGSNEECSERMVAAS